MVSIWDASFDRDRDGGYHYTLLFDGTEERLGGQYASAIGASAAEAWGNLLRALG